VTLEGWVQRLASDREKVARLFVVAYWVSTVVTLLGAAIVIWYFLGGRP
jgi:hypothetical protein